MAILAVILVKIHQTKPVLQNLSERLIKVILNQVTNDLLPFQCTFAFVYHNFFLPDLKLWHHKAHKSACDPKKCDLISNI